MGVSLDPPALAMVHHRRARTCAQTRGLPVPAGGGHGLVVWEGGGGRSGAQGRPSSATNPTPTPTNPTKGHCCCQALEHTRTKATTTCC